MAVTAIKSSQSNREPKVFRIGYIELSTPNVGRLSKYYEDVLGLRRTEASSDASYLSIGLDHHNVALRAGATAGLNCVGFQVNRSVVLSELAHELEAKGFAVMRKTDARPGVAELIELAPHNSVPIQLFHTMAMPASGFTDRGIGPLRLGHLAIMTPNADDVVRFYAEALGFYTTDWFESRATFLTCNSDHHVLNIIQAERSTAHHVAFQVRDRGHHCEAADFLARNGIATLWGPARHTAGHNFAAYHLDPDRMLIELYTDMDVLLPELGIFEPRPWHEDRPQKPKVWQRDRLNTWGTRYEFDFAVVEHS